MSRILYLARHATPDWTRSDLPYHLPPGPSLTVQGRKEAAALGRFFEQVDLSRIYTSPLQRCLETAEIAAEISASHLEILPDLIEWQPGEKMADVIKRLWPIVEMVLSREVIGEREARPSALITHGGPVAALLTACGMREDTLTGHRVYDHNNPIPPAGVWKLNQCATDHPWELDLVFVPDTGPNNVNEENT
jgi:broad specificity phosphatase PhoE